ncbi:MAG: hypothetical protein NDF54_00830 [archaeon GB-1867-035]|nr:hypothetical protein [Candidatus Culexmicrobium profundum]
MGKIIFTRRQILESGRLRRLLPIPPKEGILIVEQDEKPWSAKIRIYDKFGNLLSSHFNEYLYLELMLALKRRREYERIKAKIREK